MPLFGSLYIGASGLQTSQNTLNTTAHNMANVDTVGYTRQQILLGTRSFNTLSINASAIAYQQYGLGVYYSQVRQVRDEFLDKTYRKETGRLGFYEMNTQVIKEVEDLFGEFQGVEFSEAIDDLWVAIQELDKDPAKLTNEGLLVNRCEEFLKRAALVYQGLSDQQDNLNLLVERNINRINELGKELVALNKEVLKIEAGDIEHANDLRDRRNLILDELGELGQISYYEDLHGVITVKFEGVDFVKSEAANEILLHENKETGFYTPYWKQLAETKPGPDGEEVLDLEACRLYDPTQKISTEMSTDIGSLRAVLLARGEYRATYQDLQNPDYYNTHISQSLLMNVQAEFDQLVYKVATAINDVIAQAAASEPDTDYMKDENGNPYQVFELISQNPDKGYSITNMIINDDLKREPSRLSFRLKDGSEDKETTRRLVEAFSEEEHILNPNLKTKTNLAKYYANLVAQVANTGEANREITEAQESTVNETFSAREMIVGVSSDEEMEFMIKFQNAFNASSRYVNVIDEMIEHILNTLGR
ncbi:MAG: flagellar hook-associated protein FlgK [Lachnospiraceae bacterium]|nr:flagellar hook-associated protein FlgK [Lachnospiraceae bacterium]